MSAFLAPSLVALRGEVNARWPHRDRRSDGWLGDAAHAGRPSDHNPDSRGMVHATDTDVDGIDVKEFLRTVIGDPRVWYVIHDRVIYSRTHGWVPKRYTGSNPHTGHVHVSIRYMTAAEQSTYRWFGGSSKPSTGMPTVDLSNVAGQAKKALKGDELNHALPGVRLVQAALNERLNLSGGNLLDVDGYTGPRTLDAMKAWQMHRRRHGGRKGQIDGVPNEWDLRTLGRGRFKVRL